MKWILAYMFIVTLLIGGMYVAQPMQVSASTFKSAITAHNVKDDIMIERYCGYLVSVGHGSVAFEDGSNLENAFLIFENGDNQPRSVRILYGDEERIRKITASRFYEIVVRRYADGSGFPRSINVVESCK